MLQRHEVELMNRLERVVTVGSAEILHEELKLWYGGMQRLSLKAWRDIADRWHQIVADDEDVEESTLLVGEADGRWVFVWGQGLGTTEESWFQDIRFLAKKTDAYGVDL